MEALHNTVLLYFLQSLVAIVVVFDFYNLRISMLFSRRWCPFAYVKVCFWSNRHLFHMRMLHRAVWWILGDFSLGIVIRCDLLGFYFCLANIL